MIVKFIFITFGLFCIVKKNSKKDHFNFDIENNDRLRKKLRPFDNIANNIAVVYFVREILTTRRLLSSRFERLVF